LHHAQKANLYIVQGGKADVYPIGAIDGHGIFHFWWCQMALSICAVPVAPAGFTKALQNGASLSVNMRKVIFIVVVSIGILTACNHESADEHPGQPVTQRRAIFRRIAHSLEQMGLVLRDRKDYDPQEFSANAMELNRLASEPCTSNSIARSVSPKPRCAANVGADS
jgi:hypothetical protein